MILNALTDLYERLAADSDYKIARPGYAPQQISFRIIVSPDGRLFDIADARQPDTKGKLRSQQRLCLGFEGSRSREIKPYFLCDKSLYALGYDNKEKDKGKLTEKFESFRKKVVAAESEINDQSFSAVCRFLESWSVDMADQTLGNGAKDEFLANGFGYFEIQGIAKSVDEQPKVVSWWDNRLNDVVGTRGQCLITGESSIPIARLHPKIKGVMGGQAEQNLVSFNAPAFESYGKDQSFNAPVSEKAAFQYGTALNSLLNGPKSSKHRIRIGDTTCVFWTDQPSIVEDVFGLFASEGSNAPAQAQDEDTRSKLETLLKAIRLGGEAESALGIDPAETKFYLLGLAPNAARLSVRFFHRSTVGELLENLRSHHRDIAIVREWESAQGKRLPDPEFPAYWQLLNQTARVSDEIPPLLEGSLMRSILEGIPYPEALYSAVIRRIRADRTINYLRSAIIKGTLTRNHNQTITTMLDTENSDPAYLLGRLFAALEKTQYDALGDLNAGLRDKFYSSASATPASVFPRIIRTYQHHLAKLTGGAKVNRERLVQNILDGIPATGFPHNLNLKSQGIFALGYYHQRKEFFTKKETTEPQEPVIA
jgi:CRISPR-associated protein Csd1